MPVRNEDWCLGLTLRAALMWCDRVVVLIHASTDRSVEILSKIDQEYPGKLLILSEQLPLWEEMRHRQRMLEAARDFGTHIAMVDADELLTANAVSRIRGYAENLADGNIMQLPWICLSRVTSYYASGMWAEQQASVLFKDSPGLHWRARNGYDFHHRHPIGTRSFCVASQGRDMGLMHLQFLSKRRLYAKQFLYQLTERLRWPSREPAAVMVAKYSATVKEALCARELAVPEKWWDGYQHLMDYLDVDAEPWQETECKRIIAANPGIERGLNHFGLFA